MTGVDEFIRAAGMTVLLAPDKFKGSLTAAQVADHLERGLVGRGVTVRSLPLADGGDGSVAAALHAGFQPMTLSVTGPTGSPRTTEIAHEGGTYVIEVADSVGLAALPGGLPAPLASSSRGLGDAVRTAVELGAERIVLALGGSASTDGGAGLLAGLGLEFRDGAGASVEVNGGNLADVRSIDTSHLLDLGDVEIIAASDVQNALCGPDGAAAVYGPQKGASPSDISRLEAGLAQLIQVLAAAGYHGAARLARTPGVGSAGGLGFAALILGGSIVSGAAFFLDLLHFEDHLRGCDLVITGEGRLDAQTIQGKLPAVVTQRAGTVPVIAVVGRSSLTPTQQKELGLHAVYSLDTLTADDPATNPELTGRLLELVARTLPLEQFVAYRGRPG